MSRVSPHASAGDATTISSRGRGVSGVSTHASAGDATFGAVGVLRFPIVSTHASAGDATHGASPPVILSPFQLTRPRGTRRTQNATTNDVSGFNSRVRGGRD